MNAIAAAVLLATLATPAHLPEIHLGKFSAGDIADWKPETIPFKKKGEYTLVTDEGKSVLRGHSRDAASGMIRQIKVSARDYPILRWSWKIDHNLKNENVATKKGDDFPARVYVIFPKTFRWQMKAITYVWSANMPKGQVVPSPYSKNVAIIAAESGNEKVGKWVAEERNYYEDYKKFFNEEPSATGGVAIMTDTDNTGEEATAWYGDIFLSPLPPK